MTKYLVGLTAIMVILFLFSSTASSAELPDFGLMLNDDGDLSFTSMDPDIAVGNLEAMIDSLAGTPVKTLAYSVGAGSDVLYYPTKVASVWGWRKTRYDEDERWAPRIAMIKAGMAAGIDPIRVAGERAKKLGLYFVPSYRMNDNHFMSDPFEYPLTGEFWMQHHERLTLGESPIKSSADYGKLFDFSHAEVREYRLRVLFEVIERYQDIMDGIELDFNRVQVLLPAGKGPERGHLITSMLARVRERLDQVSQETGRPLGLFVRVPPTLENCRWAGLLVEQWLDRELVDVLIPSQLMTLAHDMPIDEFAALAEPAGCKVYPSIYPRTSWMWPFSAEPAAGSYAEPAGRLASPALVRGAASNYWHMGAAGFQLYNFNLPPSDVDYRIYRDLARPESLSRTDKLFAITPAYYLDHEDTYQYRKQIPVTLEPDKPVELDLIVGDDLAGQTLTPGYCGVRLGLRDAIPEHELTVQINGATLHNGPVEPMLVATTGRAPGRGGAHPDPPTTYVRVPVPQLGKVRQGTNTLRITLSAAEADVQLVEAQLGALYTRSYSDMLMGR